MELGMETDLNAVQPLKAYWPMLVILLGRLMLVIAVQPRKAL